MILINIIDYGMGNIQSVKNAFEILDCKVEVIDKPQDLSNADGIILPGVGAFANAISNLEERQLVEPLKDAVLEKGIPLLGICLGMQLLADSSEERGISKGLSFIPGKIKKIPELKGYRLPHVGWNEVEVQNEQPLFKDFDTNSSFYFVHSYRFECEKKYISSITDYGQKITASVQKDHIFGTQFHPEKSQKKGFYLINNFINYVKNK